MLSLKLILVVGAAIVAGFGGVANAVWGPRARARRRLERGSSQIADRQIVTLIGTVRALVDSEILAPLSGRTCVGFEAVARIYEGFGKHRSLLETLVERALVPFELVTRDGVVVLVDATTAEFSLPVIPLIPRSLEREIEFLVARNRTRETVRDAGFDELVVSAGDRIVIQGMAIVEQAHDLAERGYRDAPTRVRLVPHDDHPLTIGAPK